ncbi:MAG TPA: class I SAM-dependent methyltransferase [Rhizomicrobium sp.]|nr:class I SAM-dependent methyltransferase [Rhizomicrobium sp.]
MKNIAERLADVSIHYGPVLASTDGFDVIDCLACGFRHIDPLFTTDQLRKFYESEFYESERPEYFERMEADRDWWMLRYRHYYELLEAHAPGRRLLDIGSGPGYFLEAGRAHGWQVLGFEPSRAAANYARKRGQAVVNDFFSAAEAREHGPFDVISMSMVLEHVRDPIGLIEEARSLLVPGGLLFVASPNDFNPLQIILWKKMGFQPWWVNPKHHLNYFDTGSAKSFLQARRFEVLHLETSYPLENFLLAGRNYVGNPALGRQCHDERKAFESALFLHDKAQIKALAASWAAQGIGREFIILGRKP